MYNMPMIKTLNIVNGDACIDIMRKAKIEGDFLPWQDFLHEGSVPANLTLEELSLVRAKFISDYGLGTFDDIKKDFDKRDKQLNSYKDYDKVVLWFEHDLYDQLQLLQLLSWFSIQGLGETRLSLICTNNYLGESTAQQIKKLLHYETPILKEHLKLGKEAWFAFCHNTPERFAELLNESTAILPYLKNAIYRLLEEYPNTENGLSRTAHQALLVVFNGANNPLNIFKQVQKLEERKFMGDVIFWKILDDFEQHGVIERKELKLHLTSLGEALLKGEKYWFGIAPLERSIGGVDLTLENLWCWDKEKQTIEKYYYSNPLEILLKIK